MEDPATNFSGDFNLTSRFAPYGGVYTQIVMGNFLGNPLSVPLLFYLSQGPAQTEWAMRVLTPTNSSVEQTPLTQGPEFYSSNAPAAVRAGSVVAGDFNGDGKDRDRAFDRKSDYCFLFCGSRDAYHHANRRPFFAAALCERHCNA